MTRTLDVNYGQGVLVACSDFLLRHRRAILLSAVVTVAGAVSAAARGADPNDLGTGLVGAALVLMLLSAFLVQSSALARADVFLVADGGFATPRTGALVLAGCAHLALIGSGAVLGVPVRPGDRVAWLVLLGAVAAPLAGYGVGLWRGRGLQLSPQGLRVDKMSGTMVVPWAALRAEQAAQDSRSTRLVLDFARAELISTTGYPVDLDLVRFDRTRLSFVAAAVRHYLDHPQDRPQIGTVAGYQRLLAALAAPTIPAPAVAPPAAAPPVTAPRRRQRHVTLGVLLAVVALPTWVWLSARLDGYPGLDSMRQFLLTYVLGGVALACQVLAPGGPERPTPAAPPVAPPPARPPWSRDVTNGPDPVSSEGS